MTISNISGRAQFRVGTALVTALLTAAALGHFASVRGSRTPSLEWDTLHHDVGSVRLAEPITCTYVVHNSSTHAVVVRDVRASCGCITHALANPVIGPHASCEIAVEVGTSGIEPPAELNKYVDVTLEQDGQLHTQRLTLSARLRPALSVKTSSVLLALPSADVVCTGKLAVERDAIRADEFRTLTLNVPNCYRHAVVEHTDDRCVFAIEAAIDDLPVHLPPLELTYRDQWDSHAISVPVQLTSDQPVRVVPPALVWTVGADEADGHTRAGRRQAVRLELPDGQAVRIVDVKNTSAETDQTFSWRVASASGDRVEFTVDEPPSPGQLRSARFAIVYERLRDGLRGRATLHAHVVTKGDTVATAPLRSGHAD